MGATPRRPDEKTRALALPSGRCLDRAEEELYEVGFYGGDDDAPGHYATTSVRVGGRMLPAIRSANDDREVLGDVAKQLVIAGIPFRLVTVR